MAKADAVFTIGADASAFARETKKVEGQTNDFLSRLGSKFFGLQAIAVGVQKAFAGLSAPLRAFGELENTQAQLAKSSLNLTFCTYFISSSPLIFS